MHPLRSVVAQRSLVNRWAPCVRILMNNRTLLNSQPIGLGANAVRDISGALNILLADVFGLYVKTKNFPLAHVWPAFPGLSSSARRARNSNLRNDRTLPSGYARSAVRW